MNSTPLHHQPTDGGGTADSGSPTTRSTWSTNVSCSSMGIRDQEEWDKVYGYPNELDEEDDPSLCSSDIYDVENEPRRHHEYVPWWKEVRVGDTVDAFLKGMEQWAPAEVLDIFPEHMVRVCVRGGSSGVDSIETCPIWDSRRIAPSGSGQHFHSSTMQRPRQGDVFMILHDQSKTWVRAVIVDEDIPRNLVLFRFEDSSSVWKDEWMEWEDLFDPSHAKPLHISSACVQQPPSSSIKRHLRARLHDALPSRHRRAISAASVRYNHYISALRRKRLCVHPVEGDGNCLFRSVSHQVYGTDDLHRLVRQSCMDYMKSEAEHFEPYVEGGMSEFLQYVRIKSKEGVWGDDPELQAMCEMYNCSAEVWSYDAVEGAKPLLTYHDAETKRGLEDRTEPKGLGGTEKGEDERGTSTRGQHWMSTMRLSYYGGGHYDSLLSVEESNQPRVQHLQPGLLEQEALEWSLRRHEAAAQCKSDDAVGLSMVPVGQEGEKVKEGAAYPNEVELKKALQQSCDDYDSHHPDLEQALAISLQSLDEVAAIKDSELTVLQEEMISVAQRQSAEDKLVATALQASLNEFNCPPPSFQPPEEEAEVLEQELLAAVLAESMRNAQDTSCVVDSDRAAVAAVQELSLDGRGEDVTNVDEVVAKQ